jgi:hypothetical protein
VQFEAELGSFRIRSAPQGSVNLRGVGLARVWTARALERVGYLVVENQTSLEVVADSRGLNRVWRIAGEGETCFGSIEDLVEALAARTDHRPGDSL